LPKGSVALSLFHVLCEVLDREGWDYEYDSKNEKIRLEIRGVHTNFSCLLIVDDEQESILCNTYVAFKVPEAKRLAVCEFMNRANYELPNGNFEMDMDDGSIRFRTFLDLAAAQPSSDQILNLIWTGAQSFDTYSPGLMKLLYGNFSVVEAIEFCSDEVEN